MNKNNSIIIPAIMLLTGAAVGALSGLFIKTLPFSTASFLGFRLGVPFLVMLPYVIRKGSVLGKPRDRILLWSGGFLNLVRMIFYIIAFKLTTMGNAVVLLYLWPVFALAVAAVKKRQLPELKNIIIMLTAFSGVVIMNIHREFSLDNSDIYGSLSMIISAFLFSIAVLIYKKALSGYSEGEVVYFQNSFGAVFLIPFLLKDICSYQITDILLGVLYGFLVGIVTFMLFFYALKRVSLFQYSIMTYSEILFTVIFGMIFLGESLVVNQVLGMIIVVVSSFVANRLKDANS